MNLAAYDFNLPEDLIAQHPAEHRDASRLMVVHRRGGMIEHRAFRDIVEYLAPADALVLNRTRVMPARLLGTRPETGGKVEVVLVRQVRESAPALWEALLKPGARLARGTRLDLEGGALTATVEDDPGPDIRHVRFGGNEDVTRVIEQIGRTPLPPYIRRSPDATDRDRYQTVYAEEYGAVAAPTAGLHFTAPLLDRIRSRGTAVVPILLHVGPGTFQPIRSAAVEDHEMDAEYYRMEAHEAETILKRRGEGRVVAVGTTVVRTLETIVAGGTETDGVPGPERAYAADGGSGPDRASAAYGGSGPDRASAAGGAAEGGGGFGPGGPGDPGGPGGPGLEPRRYEGRTRCFIYPPYNFRLVDALLTNFHLPKSTLLLLVSAFAGRERILSAYEEAVREKYRFYSYGDAMLIV